jgi:hypothetical protein
LARINFLVKQFDDLDWRLSTRSDASSSKNQLLESPM